MTALTRAAIRPFYAQASIERLSRLARLFVLAEKLALALGGTMAVVIVIQVAYPSSLTRPLQHVGTNYVGFKSTQDLAAAVQPLNNHMITAVVNNQAFVASAQSAGITVDSVSLSRQLRSYSWRERLLPGTLFKQTALDKVPTKLNQSAALAYAKNIINKTYVAPKDASLTRHADGSYTLNHQVTGVTVAQTEVLRALQSIDPIVHSKARLSASMQQPTITDSVVENAVKHYDQSRQTPLTLSYNNTDYTISPAQLTAWTSIVIDPAKQTATVSVDAAAIRSWLSTSVPLVLQQPGISTVTLVNGTVQSQSAGAAGRGIDLDSSVNAIIAAIQSSKPTATAAVQSLSPQQKFIRQYTPTNDGLNALIRDWAKDYRGLQTGVSLQELGGQNRSAAYNSDTMFKTASIYKMFVAWYAYNHAEAGSLDLQSASPVAGKTIEQCLEVMIVNSDNPCGEGLGDLFGWSNVNNLARNNGYSHTDMASSVASSASDTTKLLVNLATGNLISSADSSTLLGYMQRQIYRNGIPAGSAGATVQDKVGFNPGEWNDTAIVRGAHSTYVLTIYTNGNVNAIRDLAARLYALMQT